MAGNWMVALAFAGVLAGPAAARDVAGQFDYYVLALSWSPSWCASTGDNRGADQCAVGQRIGFVVHGLWPQYERGWPERCATAERDPSRRESQAMADIMGSGGLAWYQWQKHGRCSGLSARGYYAATRQALDVVAIPEVFTRLNRDIRLPPAIVEDAFIEANPALGRDGITVTCRDAALQEVRICLTRNFQPRDCAPDTRRDCPLPAVTMAPPR
ncbi:MAG: ribonuclease T2 [Paracoccus sp. (in: a-proteobacteria)]|uniref:ribonuclease T2 n=1 Tax=Paracoccus sp. TaxID=267 RepID=UPI0026DF2B97|nr:ribonuclease T2 [Paracoccus sp. (in: a-proteobacteria)]MDO5630677.1 ribonuclease T2 [Paracoccus sp. (in: a-proteobacteria)]